MPNSIGEIDYLAPFLFEFDPKEVYNQYDGWRSLFVQIEQNYTPPGKMEINNSENYWVIYTKSIISASKFLSKFNSFKEFEEYINQFVLQENIDLRIALPLLLSEELSGFGFALSCDFKKENVSPKFIKPDVHIKNVDQQPARVCLSGSGFPVPVKGCSVSSSRNNVILLTTALLPDFLCCLISSLACSEKRKI